MLHYELEEIINGWYIYGFYPENNQDWYGKIGLKEDGEKRAIQESSVDVQRYYMGHAFNGIKVGSKWGTVAWC